jgi:Fur family ferric uptake transcriptional regulator
MNGGLTGLKDVLRDKGYRFTKQRKATVEAIIANQGKHMSAEEIYLEVKKTCPEIGLATVYRTMILFEEAGMLNRHNFDDGRNRYELNNPEEDHHHHHLVCIKCGSVTEVEEDLLDLLEEKIEKQHQFEIVDHKVKFTGYCKDCR